MLLTTATRILGLVLVAQAAPLSVSELLADPERFNGQPVTVTVEGTFQGVKRRVKVNYSFEEITARNVTCLPTPAPTGK
jgi:hypothetical protein